jgi:BlaI family penicillinase repressor
MLLENQHNAVPAASLSRRERQIMDILYQRGKSSASEIRAALPAAPGYSAVRAMLRILEEKGHVSHQAEGLKYVYLPTVARDNAKRSAVKHLVDTFFTDAPDQVVAALLDVSATRLSNADLDRMAKMIEAARKEGK